MNEDNHSNTPQLAYQDTIKIISTWLPKKMRADDNSINKFLEQTLEIDLSPFIDEFMIRLDTIDYNFSDNCLVSGFACFMGSVLMSLQQVGEVRNMNHLFIFASCYMLMDHYLDDETVKKKDKMKMIAQIKLLMVHRDSKKISNPIVQLVAQKYLDMVRNNREAKKQFKNLFKAEVTTFAKQSKHNLSEKEYLEIAEWKGGATCQTIQSLLGLKVGKAEWELGATLQIVDDMIDLDEDIKSDIHTIATFNVKEYGSLETLFITVIARIHNMADKYNFFKPVLILGAMFGIYNHSQWVSKQLLEAIEDFIPYKPTTNKEKMKARFIRLLKERSSVYT